MYRFKLNRFELARIIKKSLNPMSKEKLKGRPNYYKTPTRNFTQYTKDCEEKYWSKETEFDWAQDVKHNLKENLENLESKELSRIFSMVLPMIAETIALKTTQIQQNELPFTEDALKDIGECIPSSKDSIHKAVLVLSPLKEHQFSVSTLEDQLEILQSELIDLNEQQSLGLIKVDNEVIHIKSEKEREKQDAELLKATNEIEEVKIELKKAKSIFTSEQKRLKLKIEKDFYVIKQQVLNDLKEIEALIQQTLQSAHLPDDSADFAQLKELVLKRQLRGLRDIANHALVVEQSAIAPLSMGIIHYTRYREIQEAMTTFINDEAKHSATFRRFLVEKLEAKEFISAKLIDGAKRYMWLARLTPGVGMFLAVIVEAIGAAYLEFFSEDDIMPDKLFCSICKTISIQDETRHMDLCVGIYNELFRTGTKWERMRNNFALKTIMKSVYGDKTEEHQLIQAFRAFGIESDVLYGHLVKQLSKQLARISLYVEPEKIMGYIGRK